MQRKPHSGGDRLRKYNVWRNYAPAKNNNSNPCRGYRSGPEWGAGSGPESGAGSGPESGPESGAGSGCLGYPQYDKRSLHFPPLEEPRQASKQQHQPQPQQKPKSHQDYEWRNSDAGNSSSNSSQSRQSPRTQEQEPPRRLVNPSFALLQQQSGIAQALLPRWVQWQCSSNSSTTSPNTQGVPRQGACPETATGAATATAERDFERVAPLEKEKEKVKPMTTLTARVISRDGPFGPSSTIELVPSGSNEGAPLGASCVNLVFESFGMIGISPNSANAQVYDIKRSPDLSLTSQQKQRLHDAIEKEDDGQVLEALDKVIQEIRQEIDQMSPDLGPSNPHPGRKVTSAIADMEDMEVMPSDTPGGVHDGAWTWASTTPTSKSVTASPISQCRSPKIRHNNWKTNLCRNAVTRPRTMRGKSHSPLNHTANGSHFPEAASNAETRSQTGYPVDVNRSSLDFSQPPFPRKG